MPWLSSEHINSGPSSSIPSPQCCRLAHSWWCEYVDLSTTAFILAVIALLGFCGLILSEFFFFSCVYRFDLCLFSVVLGLFYIFFLLNCTSFLEPWFLSLKMITWAKDGWVWASGWSAGELAWGTVQCWVWENDVLTIAVLLLICFWAKLSALGKQKEWNAVLKCKDSEESSCTSSHQCSNRDPLTWTPRFPLNSCCIHTAHNSFSEFQAKSCVCHVCGIHLNRLHSCLYCVFFGCFTKKHIHDHAKSKRHNLGKALSCSGTGAGIGSGSTLSFQKAHCDERVLVKLSSQVDIGIYLRPFKLVL